MNKKTTTQATIKSEFKKLFYALCALGMIALIYGFFLSKLFFVIVGIAGLIIAVYFRINMKQTVESFTEEKSKYGEIKFMKDEHNYLKSGTFETSFGKCHIELEIVAEEERELVEYVMDYVYEIQDDIVSRFYDEAKACCDKWEGVDGDSKLFTYDDIREKFEINSISIKNNDGETLANYSTKYFRRS